MLAKKEMSDEPWTIKRDEIKAKRFLERAPADLRIKMESLDCRALVWKGGRWCRCSHDESSQPLESRRRSVIKLELCVWASLSSGSAWHSVEISLKPLLTPDKWTNLSKKNAYFAYGFAYCSILFDIFSIFCILQYAKYAEYEPCTIYLHIVLHILHIFLHAVAYSLTYSAYFAYYNMQNMQNLNPALLFCILFCICCILFCIQQHIIWHIQPILHIAICKICRIWTLHCLFEYCLAYCAHCFAYTSICINMQNNVQTPKSICRIVQGSYFAYW